MIETNEPFITVTHSISELSQLLSGAGISENLIRILLNKVKNEKVTVAVVENKILLGFAKSVLNKEGKLETKFTSLSVTRSAKSF